MSKVKSTAFKTGINLALKEEKKYPLSKLLPWLIVILVIAAAISKFGVMDRFDKLNEARSQTAQVKAQRDALENSLKNYADVENEYRLYSIDWMGDSESGYVLRSSMAELIKEVLLPAGELLSVSSTDSALSVSMSGLSLGDAARLVTQMDAREDVALVTFGMAQTQTDADTDLIITFSINMQKTEQEVG